MWAAACLLSRDRESSGTCLQSMGSSESCLFGQLQSCATRLLAPTRLGPAAGTAVGTLCFISLVFLFPQGG